MVMSGVSYLAISQYAAAALRPPALKAIVPWEGFTDAYRDLAFPGGVREKGFLRLWSAGVRRSTRQSYDMMAMGDAHPLRDEFWQSLVPDLSAITIPMLVCGSFSDHNLHTRGSFRAFQQTNSRTAHLYTHRGGKWATYYSAPARAAQLAFIRTALDDAPDRNCIRAQCGWRSARTARPSWPFARNSSGHWHAPTGAGCICRAPVGSAPTAPVETGQRRLQDPLPAQRRSPGPSRRTPN